MIEIVMRWADKLDLVITARLFERSAGGAD